MNRINGRAYCAQYGIPLQRLFEIADANHLPRAKLTPEQSQKLLKVLQAEAKPSTPDQGEQTSLF